MAKDSVVFYKSFFDAIKNIPEEQQLKLYNSIFEYCFDEIEPDLDDGVAKAIFSLIKPNIDSANARYKACVENGKKGGRKPKQNQNETKTEPKQNQSKTKTKPKQNQN